MFARPGLCLFSNLIGHRPMIRSLRPSGWSRVDGPRGRRIRERRRMGGRCCRCLAACFCLLIVLPVVDSTNDRCGLSFAGAPAAAGEIHEHPSADRPVERLAVGTPQWRRGSGLVYGTMVFTNGNDYPVRDVMIGCDFFDEWGNPIGTKKTLIRRVVSPGRTQISGIYFTLIFANRLRSNALAGACRIISAKRVPGYPTPTS